MIKSVSTSVPTTFPIDFTIEIPLIKDGGGGSWVGESQQYTCFGVSCVLRVER